MAGVTIERAREIAEMARKAVGKRGQVCIAYGGRDLQIWSPSGRYLARFWLGKPNTTSPNAPPDESEAALEWISSGAHFVRRGAQL